MRGAGLERCGSDEPGKVCEQDAGEELEEYLEKDGSGVVLDAEEFEAQREEERVAGKADERGKDLSRGEREAVGAVEEQIFGDAAVDESVAIGFKEVAEEPNAQRRTGEKRQRK